MASETITRNDLTAILNSVLPNPADMTPQEVEDFIDSLLGQGSNLADFVVEQGTSGIFAYRKWNSGVAECWGTTASRSVTTSGTHGSLYYTNIEPIATFPSGLFVSAPTVTATRNETGQGFGLLSLYGVSATSFNGYIINGLNQTLPMSFAVYAVGRWK